MEYNEKILKKFEKELSKHYGENIVVFHEVTTDGELHIDCELFNTRIGNDEFYTLATIGMSMHTMEQAVENVMNRLGIVKSTDNEAVMEIDGQAFGRLVYKYNNKENRRIGTSMRVGGAY